MEQSEVPAGDDDREPKLLERARQRMRAKHLSFRTEKAYVYWMRKYILFHGKRHPKDMGEAEINAFLTYLAVEKRISASTQTQALCALLYLYREVLGRDVGELEGLVRAKRRRRLPVVLTREEVRRVLSHLEGAESLFPTLLYGTGLDPASVSESCSAGGPCQAGYLPHLEALLCHPSPDERL